MLFNHQYGLGSGLPISAVLHNVHSNITHNAESCFFSLKCFLQFVVMDRNQLKFPEAKSVA